MSIIKIVGGKRGYHLRINGLYILQAFGGDIKAIKNKIGIPYGATEWVSIKAIKNFWSKYRVLTVKSIETPYESINGRLIKISQ
jgi:hypothetical protein